MSALEQAAAERDVSAAKGPLAGLLVLDIATLLAGPFIASMLADFGATVIKIEHPRGDSLRGHGRQKDGDSLAWKTLNRNKLGAILNLSDPADAEVFKDLAVDADVVVENFRPGTLERWGLGWEALHELNPRLILTRVTAFGQEGPYSGRPGFGTLAEAMSGFAHITGPVDGPPTLPPFGLGDMTCAMTGTWATMIALYNRDARGGSGQFIDVTILEPLITILGAQAAEYHEFGVIQGRTGNSTGNTAPRNTYLTADGRWVALSTSANTVAERMLTLVGRQDLTREEWFKTAGGRGAHGKILDDAVASWMAAHTMEDALAQCEEAGAAVAPVYTIADLVNDPHLRQRQSFVEVPDAVGDPILMPNVAPRLSDTPGSIRRAAPQHGEHDDAVRRLAKSGHRLRAQVGRS